MKLIIKVTEKKNYALEFKLITKRLNFLFKKVSSRSQGDSTYDASQPGS